jgi:transmembrane sensor
VSAGTEPVVLMAGDVAHVTPGRSPSVAHDAKIADAFGWTRGQLTFRATPLADVIPELERVYDLDITLSDPRLAARRITVTLADESVDDMLGTIVPAIDARYTRRGRTVLITR